MSNLLQRATTGLIFVVVLLGGILWSPFSLGVLFLAVTCLATLEFFQISRKQGILAQRVVGVTGAAWLFTSNFLFATGLITDFRWLLTIIPFFFLILIIELFKKTDNPFTNIAFTVLGLIYVALPFSLLNYLAMFPNLSMGEDYAPQLLLGFFFLIWANDTGAYLIGSMIGKRKLFERVSPNKSWEGSIGGAVSTMLVAWAIAYFFEKLGTVDWILLGLIVAVTGSLGDLVESRLKRSINIKDSGNILPGHGGFLDRFDAALMAAPFVLTYLLVREGFQGIV